jgi:hypothetical protein
MRGALRVRTTDVNGVVTEVLSQDPNYILKRSKATCLHHIYSGTARVDGIRSFVLGQGGVRNDTPLSSAPIDSSDALYNELRCTNEHLLNDAWYDKKRISYEVSNNGLAVTYAFYVDFDEAVGRTLNEVGLVTRTGKLFNHKTFPSLPKTADFRIDFEWVVEYV